MGLRKRESEEQFGLSFILQNFEGKNAVLLSTDPEIGIVKWPIRKLPDYVKEGDTVILKVEDAEEQYKLKRKLLEELVN